MDAQKTRTDNYRSPQWWTQEHTSAWERVKEAFRRDWEQTKADFSSTDGRDLNQNVADTVKQAAGTEPLPPPDVRNPVDPRDAAKDALKARDKLVEADAKAAEKIGKAQNRMIEQQNKLSEKVADARNDVEEQKAKAAEKVAEARRDAVEGIQKQQEKIQDAVAQRSEATDEWRQAEQAARYGYVSHLQNPGAEWNDQVENTLRGEWAGIGNSWDESRAGVRRGWEYATRNGRIK